MNSEGKRCTIRPKPEYGESLTSYISRVAVRNCLPFLDVWRNFNSLFQRVHLKDAIQLDINHARVVSFDRLYHVTGLTRKVTKSMSFSMIFEKFYGSQEKGNEFSREFLIHLIETKKRRFCIKCLEEKKIYKLSWQVKEITFCDRHKVEIHDKCPSCAGTQPYIWVTMHKAECYHCGLDLTFNPNGFEMGDPDPLSSRVLRDWEFLLQPDERLVPESTDDNRLTIARSMLVLEHRYSNQFSQKTILGYKRDRFKSAVKKGEIPYGISLFMLLKILRHIDLELIDYASQSIKDEELSSILAPPPPKRGTHTGPCIADWCKYYGTIEGMNETNYKEPKLFINKRYYLNVRVCLGCHLRYGENEITGSWEECDQVVSLGIEVIRNLIEEGRSINSIQVQLGITQYTVSRYLAYMSYFGLVNDQTVKKFITFQVRDDILKAMLGVIRGKGSLFNVLRVKFGLTSLQYWYYFYQPKVFRELYILSTRKKGAKKKIHRSAELRLLVVEEVNKLIRDEKPVDVESIEKAIGCNRDALTRYGLGKFISHKRQEQEKSQKNYYLDLAEKFIQEANTNKIKFSFEQFYIYIGKSKKWIKARYPEIIDYIYKAHKENRRIVDYRRATDLLEEAKNIALDCYKMGIPLFLNTIYQRMGKRFHVLENNREIKQELKAYMRTLS